MSVPKIKLSDAGKALLLDRLYWHRFAISKHTTRISEWQKMIQEEAIKRIAVEEEQAGMLRDLKAAGLTPTEIEAALISRRGQW